MVLQILVLLIAGGIAGRIGSRTKGWGLAIAATLVGFVCGWAAAFAIAYAMAKWLEPEMPFGEFVGWAIGSVWVVALGAVLGTWGGRRLSVRTRTEREASTEGDAAAGTADVP